MDNSLNILIIGGTGYIASALIAGLDKSQDIKIDTIYCLGRKKRNFLNNSNYSKKLEFINQDITKLNTLKKKLKDIEAEYIFQLSAADTYSSLYDSLNVNTLGFLNLLNSLNLTKLKLMIIPSTVFALYSKPQNLPIDENTCFYDDDRRHEKRIRGTAA